MTIQDKINQFINRAQTKITELCLTTASNLNEAFSDNRDVLLANELSDVIACFQDELLDWTDYEKELVVDYYNYKANLVNIPIVYYNDVYTYISNGETGAPSNTWVEPFNALTKTVSSNHQYMLGEIDRLDARIEGLDFSAIIPQELLDEIASNTLASHTHANKTVLDSVTQGHLDAIAANTVHRNNSGIHVTSTEKNTWNAKVGAQQLAEGLITKAAAIHTHSFSDIPGLTEAFQFLEPEKGDKGDTGASPVLQIGNVQTGTDLDISIDNTDPLRPLLNFTVPVAEDGEDFHIDKYGTSTERLRSTYNNEPEGYTYLGTDNGVLYFRKPFDESGNPISAITTSGWVGIQFVGKNGWSPVWGTIEVSDTRTIMVLRGWTGGGGFMPEIGSGSYPVYLGPNGFTYYDYEATNIKGSTGPTGTAGKIMFPELAGTLEERNAVDDAPKDFIYLDDVNGVIYRKLSDTVGDWSTGYQWKGDKGDQGESGASGNTGIVVPEFTDSELKILDNVDTTKIATFQVENISHNTTRQFLFPDKNGTFALLEDITKHSSGDIVPSTAAYKAGDTFTDTINMVEYKLYDDGIQKIWVEL